MQYFTSRIASRSQWKSVYVDSIQILNYPGLAKWINLERFVSGKVKGRKYRNRRIGELFKEIDLSEKREQVFLKY